MQLLPFTFFRWCETSWLANAVNDGQWTFAIVETIHIMAFTVLLGTIFIVNLRLLGMGLRRQTGSQVARYLAPYTWTSLAIVATTGVVLFASEAVRLGDSRPFLWKIDILVLALVTHFIILRKVAANVVAEGSMWGKVGACVSLLCWFSVALAGRAIAFI
jgi:hypothetical protein